MPLGTERPTRDYLRPVPSHSRRDTQARITARGSNPDWWNQFVQPQLDTFEQQPLVRMYRGVERILGDPTDPANMAAGFMTPARRLAQAEKLRKELETSQAIYKGYGTEHKGIRSLQNAVEKYPHLMGHVADAGIQAETTMPKAGSGRAGGYFQKIKDKTTKELNVNRETSDPTYRLKLSSWFGPGSRGNLLSQQSVDRGMTRHELGHAATALTDQPSALNYGKNTAKYGYRANPDEIRANAIEAKRAPQVGNDVKQGYATSYPKNDYMKRLENEVWNALIHPETKDVNKRAFARDFMNYEVDLPPKFYNYFYSQPQNRARMESFLNMGRSSGVTPVRRTK